MKVKLEGKVIPMSSQKIEGRGPFVGVEERRMGDG